MSIILASLAALLMVPTVFGGRAQGIRQEIEELALPAHDQVDEIELSLSREVAHTRAYLLTGREQFVLEARLAHDRTLRALSSLGPLAESLGPEVVLRLDQLREMQARNETRISALLRQNPMVGELRIEAHEELLTELFQATGRLTDAIDAAAEERRRNEIQAVQRQEFLATALLVLLAVASLAAVIWLGRRVQALAARLDQRLHEEARLRTRAERAVAARDEVVSIVAHDLRNPLNAVSMSASLVLDLPLPEGKKEHHLRLIQRSTAQMNLLIDDLLDVARIEAGHFSVERESVEVERLLQEACETFSTRVAESDIRLTCEVRSGGTRVEGDSQRLLQLLSNLLSNAVRHTPAGGSVTVRAERLSHEVHFSVSDTGPGIPEQDIPHLFDRFWQARRKRRGGAGLGLAIAAGIVEVHGGRIWVESAEGKGSTFWFTIPDPPKRESSRSPHLSVHAGRGRFGEG